MEPHAEFPDLQVVGLAEQFLDTAVLLLRHIPGVVAPSALRANAAFAIELFIKSLDSRWEYHTLKDELGLDNAYEVTSQSNVHEHKLARLFESLPQEVRDDIRSEFSRSPLAGRHQSLEDLLLAYSDTFEVERYAFERRALPADSRPPREIVDLAEFFRGYVNALPTRRIANPNP